MLQDFSLFAAGLVVGIMNAIAGGGMLIGFPVLLAVGLPAIAANVTANIVILPGSLSSAYGYRKYLSKLNRRYLLLVLPCAVGAVAGALILRNTDSHHFQELVPGLVLFAVILFAFQPYLHFHLHRHLRGRSKAIKPLALIALALLPVAVYGGYFGAGFGFIMLAFLGFTRLHEMHRVAGLKNLGSATVALVSILVLFSTHLINWRVGLLMAAGCAVGGYFGARLTQKVSTHALRIVVIIIGLSTAAYLILRSY
jgi:uncharacterized membrane protein YfcA